MKCLLSLLVAFGSTSIAMAQFEIGPKAGFNYHFQSVSLGDKAPSGASSPDGTNGYGFHAGGFALIKLSKKLHLRPEVLYSSRSSSAQLNSDITILGISTTIDRKEERTMSYLEVPVLLGYKLSKTFNVHGGPGFGALMSNKVKTTGTRTVTSNMQTVTYSLDDMRDNTDGLRPVEFSAVFGVAYHAKFGLDVGVRYWRGLNTLNDDVDLVRIYQNVVQFWVGYAFTTN